MHHLEPLSFEASLPGAFHFVQRPEELTLGKMPRLAGHACKGRDQVRSSCVTHAICGLISAFRRGVEQSVAPTGLAAIANAALELARIEFALLGTEPWSDARFTSKCNRCIADLEVLVDALTAGQSMPTDELMHAMDTLIALLVQMDGA
jgi:hypothetical protein